MSVQNKKENYITWALFIAFNVSLFLISDIFLNIIDLGDTTHFAIALFVLSLFLILSPVISVKLWLVKYLSVIMMILYTIFWGSILVLDFEWYYKILAVLMIIPAPYHLIITFRKLFEKWTT